MNHVIWSFAKANPDSMVASTRLACWLAKVLQKKGDEVHLEWGPEALRHKKIDVLVCVNGAYVFCKYLSVLAELILRAKRIIWVQQDYFIRPPTITSNGVSPFRAAVVKRHKQRKPDIDLWTTLHSRSKETPGGAYVNWNALAYEPTKHKRGPGNPTLLYYGAWRDACDSANGRGGKNTRFPYFERYFTDPPVNTIISSASKQFGQRYNHKNIMHWEPIPRATFFETLSHQGLGLFIEDRKSHGGDTSPPTRFYEMLSAGLPMVFQPEAAAGLAVAGFDVGRYQIDTLASLPKYMRKRAALANEQQDAWAHTDYRAELEATVRKLWRAYTKEL